MKLHKEKGLNPRLTFCPRCGGDGPDLMLVGAEDGKYECGRCHLVSYGRQPRGHCPKCKLDHQAAAVLEP